MRKTETMGNEKVTTIITEGCDEFKFGWYLRMIALNSLFRDSKLTVTGLMLLYTFFAGMEESGYRKRKFRIHLNDFMTMHGLKDRREVKKAVIAALKQIQGLTMDGVDIVQQLSLDRDGYIRFYFSTPYFEGMKATSMEEEAEE